MNEMLQLGQVINTESSRILCQVKELLGSGGQGEVYKAYLGEQAVALKWYFPHYLQVDTSLRNRLEAAISLGAPSESFLWPIELASTTDTEGFGYIMQLRSPSYRGMVELMRRKIEPSFRALATAGFELSDSFFQLHSKGLCYRDISFGNVFLNADSGKVLICDNDNVDIDGESSGGVLGTQCFMAPEIVRAEAKPSTQTDLFSLSVLLFYMFFMHHPLEGEKEHSIRCLDAPARKRLYGETPIFIFDPDNDSNRPVPNYHDNARAFWPIYSQFFKELFIKAFTDGLHSPNARVRESEWRKALVKLRDSIIYCPYCGAENFYDVDTLKVQGQLNPCWSCRQTIQLPPRIRIGKNVVMLNHDTELFPHHVDDKRLYDFSQAIAKVNQHPTNPNLWGLKNLSAEKWVSNTANTVKEVEPGRSVPLAVGTKINFGKEEGEIRL